MRRFLSGFLAFVLPAMVSASGLDHGLYGRVLSRFVRDARVDYAALHADPKDLDAYLDSLASVTEAEFRRWPAKDRLAFLLNLYNARTLRLIADHYPIRSIKDIGNILKGPWDQPVVSLFGKTITLGHLEHTILRKEYNDPRVHFALVCAAKGCPPLLGEPYVASRLDAQLDERGGVFMAQREKNRLEGDVLFLSPIFDWFEEDFEKKSGSVLSFVAPYFPPEEAKTILSGTIKIKYTSYDWTLNERSPR
jgi:hypothetical protein